MLPALVITLREGLEASLIVGIVAAFLKQRGRSDAIRWMWVGVALAAAICGAVAVGLDQLGKALPQARQEGLETVVGAIAIAAVAYMVFWMRQNARNMRRELERTAGTALAQGSVVALVGMAFLAVIREGFETAVFLVAIFQSTTATGATSIGAAVGLAIACAIGWGIYAGGVVINLQRVFRATGCVLALVAGGLAATAIHTAHEAGWLNALQTQALDLRSVIHPGTPVAALFAGLLGVQPQPTVGELLAYVLVAGVLLTVVLLPVAARRRRVTPGGVVAVAVVGAVLVGSSLIAAGCSGSDKTAVASAKAGSPNVAISLTDHGCSPSAATVPAGPVNFEISNGGSGSVTEFEVLQGSHILGERENVVQGLNGQFSLDLQAGTYTLNCPGGTNAHGTLTVTGLTKASTKGQFTAKAVADYRTYLLQNSTELVRNARTLQAAIATGDLAAAQAAYPAGRVNYERIEPVAESFGDLDPQIDARISDPHPGAWSGFHPIEQLLFQKHTLVGASALAEGLVANTADLHNRITTIKLQPAQLANGATDLLNEVAKSKITGEEERYSHIDLLDFQGNLDGAQEAASLLYPQLSANGHGALVSSLEEQFANVQKALGPYHTGPTYALYTTLKPADTKALAQAVDALAEPLSGVSALVA